MPTMRENQQAYDEIVAAVRAVRPGLVNQAEAIARDRAFEYGIGESLMVALRLGLGELARSNKSARLLRSSPDVIDGQRSNLR